MRAGKVREVWTSTLDVVSMGEESVSFPLQISPGRLQTFLDQGYLLSANVTLVGESLSSISANASMARIPLPLLYLGLDADGAMRAYTAIEVRHLGLSRAQPQNIPVEVMTVDDIQRVAGLPARDQEFEPREPSANPDLTLLEVTQ